MIIRVLIIRSDTDPAIASSAKAAGDMVAAKPVVFYVLVLSLAFKEQDTI